MLQLHQYLNNGIAPEPRTHWLPYPTSPQARGFSRGGTELEPCEAKNLRAEVSPDGEENYRGGEELFGVLLSSIRISFKESTLIMIVFVIGNSHPLHPYNQ